MFQSSPTGPANKQVVKKLAIHTILKDLSKIEITYWCKKTKYFKLKGKKAEPFILRRVARQ